MILKDIIVRLSVGVVAILLVSAAAGFLWLRTSLPGLSETVTVRGLGSPVEIIHDANGIPHILADSAHDAYMSLGFVHARDRLFQMDFMRRLGAGRLSEVIGPPTVGIDRTMRTLGLYRLAGETLRRLPTEERKLVDAYAKGVNAFLRSRAGALPPEFVLLQYEPEDWKPADSMVWGRLMAMRLTGNWRTEALRAALAQRLNPDQITDLWPGDSAETRPTLARIAEDRFPDAETVRLAARLLREIPAWLDQISASNSWALSGKLTKSGKPILANDPHLGFRAPGLWYLARISAPGLNVTGATVPGVPVHVLGHNGRIAWAFTTTGSDTQDLFVERLTSGVPGRYETPAGPKPFETRQEKIGVKGADAMTVTIRETRHGPVISDIDSNLAKITTDNHVIALASTGLRADDVTPLALLKLNRAQNWAEFRSALRNFHAPQQNISYADIDGNIGLIAPGRVPVRKAGKGGRPVPGWTGEFDWTGLIPFDELPQTFNPADGRLVNANHRVAPANYRQYLTDDWAAPYRAQRIDARLSSAGRQTIGISADLQNDTLSMAAKSVVPVLLHILDAQTGEQRQTARMMADWDGRMSRDRAEPLIFAKWLAEVNRSLYADELGPLFGRYFGLRPRVVIRMLTEKKNWCDDISTPLVETCRNAVASALDRTLASLKTKYGQDKRGWRWGAAHQAHFRHPLFGRVPVLRDLADIRIESDGGPFTVNRAQPRITDPQQPFANVHGPGYRAIYDLSNLANSEFAIATGQSGNPLSPRYADSTRAWRDGKYIKIPQTRADAIKDTLGITRLKPAN